VCDMASNLWLKCCDWEENDLLTPWPRLDPPFGDELVRETDSGGDVSEALAQPPEHGFTLLGHEAALGSDGHLHRGGGLFHDPL
jgi:hypothetical protein